MASTFHDYDFLPKEPYATEASSLVKTSPRGPVPVNQSNRQQTVNIGPFTKIPNRLFGSGMARNLKSSATLLYVALCDHANRHGMNTFKASDRALESDTALSTRTICEARKRLRENGLITCTREDGETYVYTLPVPSWNWVPVAERPRIKMKPRAYGARAAETSKQ
jgi:hypothetical protein